ncbi:nitrate- and nitrite sensing domain-containing protein [Nocardia niigatensis]
MIKAGNGIRGRILAIVLIPSVTMLGSSVGAAAYLLENGRQAHNWAVELEKATRPTVEMVAAVQRERFLTLQVLAGNTAAAKNLTLARNEADEAVSEMRSAGDAISELDPETILASVTAISATLGRLPQIRQRLFVVAKSAGRHGVSVRLRESNHGGVQAIVVLPLTFVVEDDNVQRTTSRAIESQ